MSPEDLLELD
jgi:E3 ubiquitin-protein ligase HUWE1